MLGSGTPTVEKLQKGDRLEDLLKQEKAEYDCTPCRVTGAAAFMGLSVYSYYSGHSQLRAQEAKILASKSLFGMKSRQAGITGIAFSLVGMGFWRLLN